MEDEYYPWGGEFTPCDPKGCVAVVTLNVDYTPSDKVAIYGPLKTENIGARRLHTIMEKVLEELSFDAPQKRGDRVVIDAAYVQDRIKDIIEDQDLSRFVL